MATVLRLLCRLPPPEMPDGWSSEKWKEPKVAEPVVMWRESPDAWRQDSGVTALIDETIVDTLCISCAPEQVEAAEEYLEVVAGATNGLIVVDSNEVRLDHGDKVRYTTAEQIVQAWRTADVARSERSAEQHRLQEEVWERHRAQDPDAVAFANDWSDVAPDSEPPPPD